MSSRDRFREMVRERIEEFRRMFGKSGSARDLHSHVVRDAQAQGWDDEDLAAINQLVKDADVTIEVHVNYDDDAPPGGFRA